MSFWRHIPLRSYQLTLGVSLAAVLVWNYFIITGSEGELARGRSIHQLEFEANTGENIVLPDSTEKYTVLVFWAAGSERSLDLIEEAKRLYAEGEFDSLARFFWVNLSDSLDQIRASVAFDDQTLPFGYHPRGTFLDNYQIRSLPLTVIFSPEGTVMSTHEGYQTGDLENMMGNLSRVVKATGFQGEFRFGTGGR